MAGYIAFQPLLYLQWDLTDISQADAMSCRCCESGCTCSSKPGGCQTLSPSSGVAVSIKGMYCQTETDKKQALMPALRWFLVPELQSLAYECQWCDLVFVLQTAMCSGQYVGVLDKPPQCGAQLS